MTGVAGNFTTEYSPQKGPPPKKKKLERTLLDTVKIQVSKNFQSLCGKVAKQIY